MYGNALAKKLQIFPPILLVLWIKNCSSRIKLIFNLNNLYLIDEIDEDLTYAPSTVEILEISKRADKTKNIKWSGTIMEHRSCFIKFGRK